MTVILFVFAVIFQILAGAIPNFGKLTVPEKQFPFSVTINGWALIASCLLSLGFTVALFMKSADETDSKEASLRKELHLRDSLHTIKEIENTKSTFLDVSTALAGYGLKYDSAQKVIKKLIEDSAGRKVQIIQLEEPTIMFCPGQEITVKQNRGDTLSLDVFVCSKDATAINVNFVFDILIEYKDGHYFVDKNLSSFKPNSIINKEGYLRTRTTVFTSSMVSRIYFLGKGTYTGRTASKTYTFDELVFFDNTEQKSHHVITGLETEVRKKIESSRGYK